MITQGPRMAFRRLLSSAEETKWMYREAKTSPPGLRAMKVDPALETSQVARLRAFRVVALFNVGMNEYDSTFAFLPLDAAQAYFQVPGAATQIEVFVEDPTRVRAVTREIQRAMADRPVRILDWQESNNSFFAAVQVERNVMFLILTLIILVAAFNIVTTQTMLVKDKRRDIAILRTVGARRGAVMRVFLMCGAAIGVGGDRDDRVDEARPAEEAVVPVEEVEQRRQHRRRREIPIRRREARPQACSGPPPACCSAWSSAPTSRRSGSSSSGSPVPSSSRPRSTSSPSSPPS